MRFFLALFTLCFVGNIAHAEYIHRDEDFYRSFLPDYEQEKDLAVQCLQGKKISWELFPDAYGWTVVAPGVAAKPKDGLAVMIVANKCLWPE